MVGRESAECAHNISGLSMYGGCRFPDRFPMVQFLDLGYQCNNDLLVALKTGRLQGLIREKIETINSTVKKEQEEI